MKFAPLLLVALLFACPSVGKKTELTVLVPAITDSWDDIVEVIGVGIQDGIDDGDLVGPDAGNVHAQVAQLGLAINTKDVEGVIAFDWASLSMWVERGIQDKLDDGLLVPLTAESLREHHRQFTAAINELKD